MEFSLFECIAHTTFYSSTWGGYTVTQGPTGGPRAEKIV
jgi:hypothetical protein